MSIRISQRVSGLVLLIVATASVGQAPPAPAPAGNAAAAKQAAEVESKTRNTDVEVTPNFYVPGDALTMTGPTVKVPNEEEIYDAAEKAIVPLTPDEIRKFRERLRETEKASREELTEVTPAVRTVSVSLDPGKLPPVIMTRRGYSTSLVFLDSTGTPWPIFSVNVGDDKAFGVEQVGDASVVIQCKQAFAVSNIIVALKNVPTPLVWQLRHGDSEVDFRVNAMMPVPGPLSEIPQAEPPLPLPHGDSGDGLIADDIVDAFINDLPPVAATRRALIGDSTTKVWIYQGNMIIRTRHLLMTPRSRQQKTGPNRYSVYVVPKETPALTLYRDGRTALVTVDPRPQGDQ